MLALGNSVHGIQTKHKQMLYHACVLPIAMYGSRLWLYKGAAMKGPLDSLHKMQRRACLWITSAFQTSLIGAAETIMGLSQTRLPLLYPSSQLQLSASGMRGTSMMTGLQPILLCLTTPNCEQLWMAFVRHTMLVWKTYIKYMFSLAPTPPK
jgi:hypothetical protein